MIIVLRDFRSQDLSPAGRKREKFSLLLKQIRISTEGSGGSSLFCFLFFQGSVAREVLYFDLKSRQRFIPARRHESQLTFSAAGYYPA